MKGDSPAMKFLRAITRTVMGDVTQEVQAEAAQVTPAQIERLGFPTYLQGAGSSARQLIPDAILASMGSDFTVPDSRPRSGVCMVTVCTRNYLHFARTLVSSWNEVHPEVPVFVLVVDWDGGGQIDAAGATCIPGRDVGGPAFGFMALKYSAVDLCCAMKPYVLRYLVEQTSFERVLYLDSDIMVFGRLDAMLRELDASTFVTTPHTVALLPHPDRFWERPSLGDLAYAGVLNAGMFGFRVNEEACQFLSTWESAVTAPGAFLADLGGQMEQNAFNWITCFRDSVTVFRDQSYNVAYWNLHERSIRWTGFDDVDDETRWTVNGRPLVAFHFSGYSPHSRFQLSKWDARHSLYVMPSLALLVENYRERLMEHGADENQSVPYGYDQFPSGISIDARMRKLLKQHEVYLSSEDSPWTAQGEHQYCQALLSPVPYSASLIPILCLDVYNERIDLQALFPDAHFDPSGYMQWVYHNGIHEYGYTELFDRHRPVLPRPDHLDQLIRAVSSHESEILEECNIPLGRDRQTFISRLEDSQQPHLAALVRSGAIENYALSTIWLIRQVLTDNEEARLAFPNPIFEDADGFIAWLETKGVTDCGLPAHSADVFRRTCQGRSLARLFTYCNRNWNLAREFPLAFVGVDMQRFARMMMGVLRHQMEFDFEDVVMYLWTMERDPWRGLPLALELGFNACGNPSSLLPEGQDQLLAQLMESDPRGHHAVEQYRARYGSGIRADRAAAVLRATPTRQRPDDVSVFAGLSDRWAPDAGGVERSRGSGRGAGIQEGSDTAGESRLGVNLFGYHRSPIGLGSLTRGLGRALDIAKIPRADIVVGNIAMESGVMMEDLVQRFDFDLDANIFASYPHLHHDLLRSQPAAMVAGRRNIVYLAWELRDGSHYWRQVYDAFDQVWALSEFAADSLARSMDRPVAAVPCVLEVDGFPDEATKSDVGLDPDRFAFLYVFDANSSIERKNPEGFVRAFSAAFRTDDPVTLVLRVSNATCLGHRERLRRLLAHCRPGLNVRLELDVMNHHDLLRLMSACDCYVSLHRAEGFGYTCAEAMAYGKPVVASRYSGNLQFMNDDNSLLVSVEECEVEVPDGPFQRGSVWAEPDIEHAASLMRSVFEDREMAAKLGQRAAVTVRQTLSAATIAETVRELLKGDSGRGGAHVADTHGRVSS